jgi:hypothetical protein
MWLSAVVAVAVIWLAGVVVLVMRLPRERVLETFIGCVDSMEGDVAHITLRSVEHENTLTGVYKVKELAAKGIHEQSRFLCKTVERGKYIRIDLEPLPDKGDKLSFIPNLEEY